MRAQWPMIISACHRDHPRHSSLPRAISPAVQQEFAKSRKWRFPMVSHQGTTFADDKGYRGKDGGFTPGVSVFRKDGGKLLRVNNAGLQPLDDLCTV